MSSNKTLTRETKTHEHKKHSKSGNKFYKDDNDCFTMCKEKDWSAEGGTLL